MGRFGRFKLPELTPSERTTFAHLPQDPNAGARARSRRFSQYRVRHAGHWQLERLAHRPFVQSKDHNKLVGGVLREFEPLALDPTALVAAAADAAGLATKLTWQSNVHQIRVTVTAGDTAKIVPEGMHQDGHEIAALLVIGREHVDDGVTRLVVKPGEAPVFEGILQAGTGIVFDDTAFFHDTSPISVSTGNAHRDMFIIVFNRWDNARYGPEHEQHSTAS
ncbi:MAG: 2OG-Fe dioxygenase family protein [Gammaproteobacteria bacterium]